MKNKYFVLFTLVIGSFVGNLEAAMPNTAINTISQNLGASVASTTWVLTAYTLLFAVFMPLMSKVGEIIGHHKLYISSLLIFTLFSIACGVTNNLILLILFRALQGISIASCLPSAMVIIAHHFAPNERGKAMGILGMIVASSTAVGAPLGGILTQAYSWHAIFLAVVPISFIGFLLSFIALKDEKWEPKKVKFDIFGATFFIVSMILLMLFISTISKTGLSNLMSVCLGTAMLIFFLLFIFTERKVKEPFIPLTLFSHFSFDAISLSRALQMALMYCSLFLLPLYWTSTYNLNSNQTGFALFILPLTIMIISPIVGNFIDIHGSKIFMSSGMFLASLGSLGLFFFPGTVWSINMTVNLILLGLGFSMMQASSMAAVTLVLPNNLMNSGVGIFNMLTFVGGTIGLSTISAIVGTIGFHLSFGIMSLIGITGFILVLFVKNSKAQPV